MPEIDDKQCPGKLDVYLMLAISSGSRECLLCEKPITVEDGRAVVGAVFLDDRRLDKATDALVFHLKCLHQLHTANEKLIAQLGRGSWA